MKCNIFVLIYREKYFEELFISSEEEMKERKPTEMNKRNNEEEQEPSQDEIMKVVANLKNHRSLGEDRIQAEALKYVKRRLHELVVDMIQKIWKTEKMKKR